MKAVSEILDKYYQELCEAYDRNEWYFTQNEDRAHNAIIMRVMMEKASNIRMYCGEMSVFRKGFYRHVDEKYPGKGSELMNKVSEALLSFLDRDNANLAIVLERFDEDILNDLIVPRKKFQMSLGVKLFVLPEEIGNKNAIPHLAFTNDERIVRLELNKQTHQAVCKIGEGEDMKMVSPIFERLMKLAKPIAG
ncbi:MAG: hypothetical protein K2N34_04925 [Lachnospiraceae bacterium]|nr:hypothetical protein [Lachnospiraceae bacterium]